MHQSYKDITDQLGVPHWWDECGVPRYCRFEPRAMADIYARKAVLLKIRCQNCHTPFVVAQSWNSMDEMQASTAKIDILSLIGSGQLYYGDPPNYGGCCPAGPTMSSELLQVLECWQRDEGKWQRIPEYERAYDPDLT